MQIDDATRERVERLAKVVPGLPKYFISTSLFYVSGDWVQDSSAADIILARLLVWLAERGITLVWMDDRSSDRNGHRWAMYDGYQDVHHYGPTPLHAAIAAAEAVQESNI